ncbi:MAG: penicillin-binding protein [Erysipelotrichaceae bacterium]|nr:penicillin-binding protein [Erysipelotrichaceae bacterium]
MKRSNRSLAFLYFIMLTVVILVIVNVFLVTVNKVHIRSGTSLVNYVSSVSNVEEKIFASRGNIYDSDGEIVAQDVKTYDIICFLDPERLSSSDQIAFVDNPSYTAKMLAPILDMDENEIYSILTSNSGLYQIELGAKGRNLSEDQKAQIEAIEGLHGIEFRNSYKRYYPFGTDFSPQLVGFAQSDNTGKLIGKLGIEEYLDDELSGTDGFHSYQRDKYGYILPGMYDSTVEAINGYDVYLTLDNSIQEALNTALQETVEFKDAARAWGAVVEVKTGKILAWAQTPSFDPNQPSSDDVQVNYGSQLAYEAGSVIKSIIYAAAMDLGVYDGEQGFDSSPYCYTASSGRTYAGDQLGCINNVDHKNWGFIPLDYGLIYSSNVATATLLSQYVGKDNYEDYLHRFHLYQNVETDGISEISGYTNYGLSPVDDICATYGQGSSTTMLQILQAYTAIFGNGEMLQPYIIDRIVDPNSNTTVYKGTRNVVDRPISADTAKHMQDLLRRVVSDESGTCRHYAAKTVEVMGKTGTSEIAMEGEYSEDVNIVSCMLGFPYEDPEYEIYYAYVSDKTVYYNYDKKPIPDLIDRIALLESSSINSDNEPAEKYIEKYSMPNLLAHNVSDLETIMSDIDLNVIMIGDGNNIIDQYPKQNTDVYTDQKVFVKTDGNNIYLPDFSGWTRKDVIGYWNMSCLPITLKGYGVAFEQSVSPGSIVNSDTEIAISFREINHQEEVTAPDASTDNDFVSEDNNIE